MRQRALQAGLEIDPDPPIYSLSDENFIRLTFHSRDQVLTRMRQHPQVSQMKT